MLNTKFHKGGQKIVAKIRVKYIIIFLDSPTCLYFGLHLAIKYFSPDQLPIFVDIIF